MKKQLAASLVLGGILFATSVGAAQAASGDGNCDSSEFCAYDGSGYTTILLESKAAVNSVNVDVANDRTSAFKNLTANCWKGVTERTGLPDQVVLNAYANTSQSTPSTTWNNKIDHFDVRSSC